MRELADFLKKSLSNDDESPSFARMACAGLLYALVCWETYLISKTGDWHDIPANWLILVLAIWTVAKAAETVKAKIVTPTGGIPDAVPVNRTTTDSTVITNTTVDTPVSQAP